MSYHNPRRKRKPLIEVFLNGNLVLSGKGTVENAEEGEVEFLVPAEDGKEYFVQLPDPDGEYAESED